MSAAAASAYKPGDLSRLLAPSAGAPVIVSQTAATDPTFFGYLRPTKGRKPSRKSAKGGGKFSKETLAKKAKGKKEEQKAQRARHEREVVEAAERKAKEKEARRNGGKTAAADESKEDAADDDAEDSGVDESGSDADGDVDEADIDAFMKDIEAEEASGEEGSSGDEDDLDPEAKAKRERIAKREKRLAEDREMEAPLVRRKDIKKQRKENLENDPRLSRTIFVGNVPSLLKSSKLSKWIEQQLGVDSSISKSIVESVRYRSVAVADPKLPKKVAIQKGLLHESRDSLNAYVVFTEEAPWVARAVSELNGKDLELDGKAWRLRVDTVAVGADAAAAAKQRDNALTVFVGNLPFNVNENDLYSHFANCGALSHVRVVRDRESNMGKGIAFLTFSDAQSMRNALAFNHTKFGAGERELRIMKAVENKKLHGNAAPSSASSKKGGAKAPAATSAKGGRKEGYGGAHKIKEMNNAGVLKKPRHKPRDGSQPIQQPKGTAAAATSTPAAAAAAAAPAKSSAAPAASMASSSRIQGKKRAFEGEHADPTSHVKKLKVDEVKQREKKEKKRDNKKLAPAAASKKKE